MANVAVYNIEGKEVGTMELNDAVFGVEVNEHLVHMVKYEVKENGAVIILGDLYVISPTKEE